MNDNKRVKVEHLHYIFMSAIIFTFVALVAILHNFDNDYWFILTIGRHIIENGEIPVHNIWTWHEGFDIVIQQWLVAIIDYIFYSKLGKNIGLIILKTILIALANIMIYKYSSLYTENKKAKLVTLLVCNILLAMYYSVRPQAFTMTILIFEIYTLENYVRNNVSNKKFILIMCILSVLEINMHAAMWPFLMILLVPYIFPRLYILKNDISTDKVKYISISFILILLLGFINPNGLNGMIYVFESFKKADNLIMSEMHPPYIKSVYAIYVLMVIVLMFLNKELNKTKVYMIMGLIFVAILNIRSCWFLIIPLIPLMSKALGDKLNPEYTKCDTKIARAVIIVLYSITYIIVTLFIAGTTLVAEKSNAIATPVAEVEYLNTIENREDIKLFNGFSEGGYLEFNRYKVYIDPRAELWTEIINNKGDILTEYIGLLAGTVDINEFIAKYEFTHLIVNKGSTLDFYFYYKETTDYKLISESDHYKLYEHKDFIKQ